MLCIFQVSCKCVTIFCSVFSKSPVNVLPYFHNLKKKQRCRRRKERKRSKGHTVSRRNRVPDRIKCYQGMRGRLTKGESKNIITILILKVKPCLVPLVRQTQAPILTHFQYISLKYVYMDANQQNHIDSACHQQIKLANCCYEVSL